MPRSIRRALFTATAGATIASLGFVAGPASASGHPVRYFAPSGGTPIATNANCPVSPPTSPPAPARARHGRDFVPAAVVPSDNCAQAGYQASGRDFRFAQAEIMVPNHSASLDDPADPAYYVALDNSSSSTYQFTRVGIAPCPAGDSNVFIIPNDTITCPTTLEGNTSGWVAFEASATTGNSPSLDIEPLANTNEGDGVTVSIYLAPTNNSVLATIMLPDGTTFKNTFPISGPVYKKAQALADWTTAFENNGGQNPVTPSSKSRFNQFFSGRFTTVSGDKGTFNGPWTLNPVEVTTNGSLPPAGTLIAQPSYLWTDQTSYNGLAGDAFGVWGFPF